MKERGEEKSKEIALKEERKREKHKKGQSKDKYSKSVKLVVKGEANEMVHKIREVVVVHVSCLIYA